MTCYVLFHKFERKYRTYVSLKSKLLHPPRAYPGHLTPLPSRGRREFDYQSLPRGGEFELSPPISCEISGVVSYHEGILGDPIPRADSRGEGKSKQEEKYGTKKSK